MSVRILLIAALLWGSVGSSICGTLCAPSGADAEPSLTEPVAALPPCHAGRATEPEPAPWRGEGSGTLCCCPDENLAAMPAVASADETSKVVAAAGPVLFTILPYPVLPGIGARPPDLCNVTYRTQNRPLLS